MSGLLFIAGFCEFWLQRRGDFVQCRSGLGVNGHGGVAEHGFGTVVAISMELGFASLRLITG